MPINLSKIGAGVVGTPVPVPESNAGTGNSQTPQATSSPPPNAVAGKKVGGLEALFAKKRNEAFAVTENKPSSTAPTESRELVPVEVVSALDGPLIPVVESTGEAGFSAKLKILDDLIGDQERITKFDLDHVRGVVRDLMVELKQFPEFDGMVRAKDVHNLMVYVYSSSGQQKNQFALNAEKTEKAASKKKEVKDLGIDFAAFFSKPIASIEDLSQMNTDDIKPIEHK